MDQQAFENAIRKAAERTASSATIVVDFNNYNGWCIQTDASDTVYLVMMGEKRRIPNENTFKGLFASCKIQNGTSLVGSLWTQLMDEMPSGGDITDGAQLIKSTDSDAVFLLTNGKNTESPARNSSKAATSVGKKFTFIPLSSSMQSRMEETMLFCTPDEAV